MLRRTFVRTGAAGVALPLSGRGFAQGRPAGTPSSPEDASVIVVGADGSDLTNDVVDKYLAAHADVWHFLPNLAKFSQVLFQYRPEFCYKQAEIEYVDGFGSVSGLNNLPAEMQRRDYTAEEIAKILGGNWLRVFRAAWNA